QWNSFMTHLLPSMIAPRATIRLIATGALRQPWRWGVGVGVRYVGPCEFADPSTHRAGYDAVRRPQQPSRSRERWPLASCCPERIGSSRQLSPRDPRRAMDRRLSHLRAAPRAPRAPRSRAARAFERERLLRARVFRFLRVGARSLHGL